MQIDDLDDLSTVIVGSRGRGAIKGYVESRVLHLVIAQYGTC